MRQNNMDITKDEIYTFKLNSGEELIAKVVAVSDTHYTISEPVSIGPSPQGGLGLVPSLFTYNNRENVRLNTSSLALVAQTDDNVKTKYIEATTGLQVPGKKVLIG
jgi:hypothetical protein